MVLEDLINPEKAERKPWDLFFIGALYSTVAMFLSIWVFREEASIVMVLLTVIACIPLIYNTLKLEEEKDTKIEKESTLMKEHTKALSLFIFLFIGFVISFSLWYVFLPDSMVQTTFQSQINTISTINNQVSGSFILGNKFSSASSLDASAITPSSLFMQIFSNNIKVMLFCVFFAFFYGAGAIFILAWNASVISAAIGNFVRNNISTYAASIGLTKVGGYFHIVSLGLARYFIHGIPEILAYFIGGLAGGIISFAVIRHDFGSKTFKHILLDSLDLIILAVFILFVAALIEVYVTPALF